MSAEKEDTYGYLSKKCPECLTYIPLNAEICPECKKRVGKVTMSGMAGRPTNWISYVLLIIAVAAFALYIWWAFIRE